MCSGPTLTLTGSALPPSAFQGKSNQIDNEGLWLYNTLWWSQYHQCVHVQEYIWFYQQQCLVITTKWIVCAATLTPSKSTKASSIVFLHIFYRKKTAYHQNQQHNQLQYVSHLFHLHCASVDYKNLSKLVLSLILELSVLSTSSSSSYW